MSEVDYRKRPNPPLPDWLRVKIHKREQSQDTAQRVEAFGLQTVCTNARCPNLGECYGCGTATFLIMGERCTRNCRFCAVATGNPEALEADEPERLAEAAAALSLDYVVVTSVTRDDLEDGGAAHFAATIAAVHRRLRGVPVEVLIPDFQGAQTPLEKVMEAGPAVLNHNVETVRRLQGEVRPQGDYQRSLGVLGRAGRIAPDIPRKSGMMVGLGETDEEIRETLEDLAAAGVEGVTIGQYLRPTRRHMPVDRYVHPDKMAKYGEWAREAGITCAASAPYVRSSYRAAEMCLAMRR